MVYGVATSATLMVPCPWAREAARMFQRLSVGVHLTLTCEYRGYRWRGLTNGASLHDDEGFFPTTTEAALQQVDVAQARAECRAQIEAALSWGVDVTHLDTHMNVLQTRTDLYEIYLDLAEEFRLPVRMFSRGASEKQGFQSRERAGARACCSPSTSCIPGPAHAGRVLEEIPKLPPGVSEIFAHPALDGEELRAYDTDNADIRAHDAACLTDPMIADLLDQHDIKRISFRELRELQRAG